MARWRFWIDRGGTFTDIVGVDPHGALRTDKLLSVNPERYDDAAEEGVRLMLGLSPDDPLPADAIEDIRIGTTIATNALLERKGVKTLLVVNEGFADLLTIGRQTRPRLFDLAIVRPDPVHGEVMTVAARLDADGHVIRPLDEFTIRDRLAAAKAKGAEACAIVLMHACVNPEHEQRVAALAREAGFTHVSVSHETSPVASLVGRAGTTVADAYLAPVLDTYVSAAQRRFGGARLRFMQSSGGLADPASFRACNAILSGPAGGVVAGARTALAAGYPDIINFDMGGTSTDVSVHAGVLERTFEAEIAGLELHVPMTAIDTVAAGGGSILRFEDGRFQVGPESAGADPGPACYRRGGPLTVTDANVMVGKLRPERFPSIFGPEGNAPLDIEAVRDGFYTLAAQITRETGRDWSPFEVAEGFLRIAVANMARAIRGVTLDHGRDPADFALQAFGGAAGQHACLVADELGIADVLIHPMAGVLSALGMGLADQSQIRRVSFGRLLDADGHAAAVTMLHDLVNAASASLDVSNTVSSTVHRTADLRYEGVDTALPVPFGEPEVMRRTFETEHRRRFGFDYPGRAVVIASLAAEAVEAGPAPPDQTRARATPHPQAQTVAIFASGETHRAHLLSRGALAFNEPVDGPAIVCEAGATTIVEPGWGAQLITGGFLRLSRITPRPRAQLDADGPPDPVLLELLASQFMAAAERMGTVLRGASTSVNMKERLDFSCALFNAEGDLVANAPHVPVHLGAMGESVRAVLASRRATLKPGDMIALNNPFNGGTHLPDVTVIAPVFADDGITLRFFIANRGHHSDIGGTRPGSSPPDSTRLEEEGVVIDDFLLCDGGAFRENAFRALLRDAPWPARSPDVNVADIRAQVAANIAGAEEVRALVARHGWPGVAAYMRHVMANGEESVRRVIDRLSDGVFEASLDDGAPLRVAVRVDHAKREAVIDFTGTGPQRPGNFNAPPSVARSAVLYVFRCLVGSDLPLNEGCLRPLRLVVPHGSFLSPSPGAAVVAGNTEVSQTLCNVLLGALGAAAASQGTMNNLLLGDDRVQYYETIGGGSGATADAGGASAVQTHMTNTRITDPEVLEQRLPVRVETFEIRRDSSGAGRHRGGDGAMRRIRALAPLSVSLVSSSRRAGAFGLAGGQAGLPGDQWIERASGVVEHIAGVDGAELQAGDAIVVATPGGGGFGSA